MNLLQFAPNLYITDNPKWGERRELYILEMLKSVDINFSKALGTEPFQTSPCFIDYTSGNPLCSKLKQYDAHIIRISAYGNYLQRWLYEFSHEYCHHLINGAFEADVTGLIWFEETICELSSMYQLNQTYIDWKNSTDPEKTIVAHFFQDYLHDLLTQNPLLIDQTHNSGWLSSWLPFLSEPLHHRDHNNAIAVRILPLFVENPFLWKIILHFGDSRKWESPESLFDHLLETADESYSFSLNKLSELLFY